MKQIKNIFEPLLKGQELANAVKAKNLQAFISSIGALIACVYAVTKSAGYLIPVDQDTVVLVATYAGGLWMIVNSYLTIATSKKVGVGPGYDPAQSEPDNTDEAIAFAGFVHQHNYGSNKQFYVDPADLELGEITQKRK